MRCAVVVVALVVALVGAGVVHADDAGGNKIPIAVMGLKSDEANVATAATVADLVSSRLDGQGVFAVVTEDDIQQMISFDRIKSALSCDDEASCLSEIGAALGVPWLLGGTLNSAGSQQVLTLVLIDITHAKAVKRESRSYASVDELLKGLPDHVDRAVAELLYTQKGRLVVLCNDEGAVVELDGKALGTTPFPTTEVPSGPHRVTVTKEGYIQHAVDVAVRPREDAVVEVKLRPSPETLAAQKKEAESTRALAWGTALGGGAGVVAGAAGVSLFFVRREAFREAKEGGDVSVNGAEYAELASWFYGGIGAVVVGAGLAAAGGYFFATGRDPDDVGAVP